MAEILNFQGSTHRIGVGSLSQNYVKDGVFSKELSKIIRMASENREKADYLDFFIASKEEAEKQIVRAKEFIDVIKIYLESEKVL